MAHFPGGRLYKSRLAPTPTAGNLLFSVPIWEYLLWTHTLSIVPFRCKKRWTCLSVSGCSLKDETRTHAWSLYIIIAQKKQIPSIHVELNRGRRDEPSSTTEKKITAQCSTLCRSKSRTTIDRTSKPKLFKHQKMPPLLLQNSPPAAAAGTNKSMHGMTHLVKRQKTYTTSITTQHDDHGEN